MATADSVSLARMGGLSHAYHAVAHEGPLDVALSQFAASSRLLVEANEALEEETKKNMNFYRELVWLRHKFDDTEYEITYFTDENYQIERFKEDYEHIDHMDMSIW